jgi:hypothetical protein
VPVDFVKERILTLSAHKRSFIGLRKVDVRIGLGIVKFLIHDLRLPHSLCCLGGIQMSYKVTSFDTKSARDIINTGGRNLLCIRAE